MKSKEGRPINFFSMVAGDDDNGSRVEYTIFSSSRHCAKIKLWHILLYTDENQLYAALELHVVLCYSFNLNEINN